MTTYTLSNGLALFYKNGLDPVDSIDNTDVTLELVVPGSTSSFSYTVNPLAPGDQPGGDETIEVDVNAYNVRVNGITAGQGTQVALKMSIFEVDWTDGGGAHTSTVLIPIIDDFVPGVGILDADYIFAIDGAPFPAISSVAQWNAFRGTITGISVPTGTYGPGVDIPLTSLGATVTQNDTIIGTSDADTYRTSRGADDVHGMAGNDSIWGDGGFDKLFGDGGRDKLFGGNGNDVLSGGKGNDLLRGDKGRDILRGGDGKDVLNGGKGNDKMTGGSGPDTFIFSSGADRITDFNAANNLEKIDLSGLSSIKGYKDLKNNHLSELGGDVVITSANGSTLTLDGLEIADLDRGDFIF